MKNKLTKNQLDFLKALKGIERDEFFASGGESVRWLGGPHLVQKNKKKYSRKQKHRKSGKSDF